MIKINLLGLKKEIKKSAGVSAPVSMEGTKLIVFALVFLAVGLGWVYWRHTSLTSEAERIDQATKKEENEQRRLAGVKSEVDQMERAKAQLQRQIDVIEALERGRTGPTAMLNTLANIVVTTKTMWLTTFDTNGSKVNMAGLANSMITVADFVQNLKNSGWFTNIEMRETAQDERSKDQKAYTWSISADIVQPSTEAQGGAQPPAAGKGK